MKPILAAAIAAALLLGSPAVAETPAAPPAQKKMADYLINRPFVEGCTAGASTPPRPPRP